MSDFWPTLKRLLLGICLIAATSLILLLSDWKSRTSSRLAAANQAASQKVFRIGLVQHASQSILEDGVNGILQGLAEKGFTDGKNIIVKRFNPEGDLPTANAVAKQVVEGGFDLIVTASTLSMQTVANANVKNHVPHIFGLVSDPYGAGVGISRTNTLNHPPYLAGYGTMQPIDAAFRLAREMRPELKRVGVVWNPSEANSESQLKVARKTCQSLNIDLAESTAENSVGVGEAAGALIARGVEALWVPGDVTVLVAVQSLIQVAQKAHIPVFTVIPPNTERGALFDIGADYHEVGRLTGELAGEVLAGKDPASVPIENLVPEVIMLNKLALRGLRDKWTIPDAVAKRATVIMDESGKHRQEQPVVPGATPARKSSSGPLSKKWRVHLVNYNDSVAADEAIQGLKDGMKQSGLVLDRDFTLKQRNGQGDMATLNSIFDAAQADGADLFLIVSTPTLQMAIKKLRDIPIVFTYVSNPMLAGAGESYTNHLPNVTGIAVVSAFAEMTDLLKKYYPQYKRVGTLFCPAEVNSVYCKDLLITEAAARGITVESLAVNSTTDLADTSAALASLKIDAIVQISDNITAGGFSAIGRAAQRAHLPLIGFNSSNLKFGAAVVISRDYYEGGVEAAEKAVSVMRGQSPAHIPFELVKKTQRLISLPNAALLGMPIPPELKASADKVVER
jgi:ABC-type uncharacterized transport system substrate-binding protein